MLMRKLTFVVSCLLISIFSCFAQTTITGTVIDDTGETVIGASIMVEGTTVGTVTDFDGNFSLSVPDGAKHVIVSYVGMKSQTLPIQKVMNVKLLPDTQELEEVIVTGYQKIDRKMFTGAAAKVGGEDAKVAIRNIRRDAIDDVKKLEKEENLSEDSVSDANDKIQKVTDKFIKNIETLVSEKEKEVLTV